ncbi:MAG: 6-carboxytetrahydropterin synthase [Myxococcales bacterium]|nr:6-carboxytetrahydropterin synthase [Myxococcales bacterium]MCB9520003.1 6-carboxytetrahydropterin synthase [Myxococcales bacterium]MCB9534362.1 6-carboxytetrahydropterin synthase [Myxococcales bacterium]
MSAHSIEISHNFETAHRLASPDAPKKCQSIHGHSWWVVLTVAADALDADDMVVEFGALKAAFRRWIDDNLDHALVLRDDDPMAAAVRGVYPESRLLLLPQSPTTEIIAKLLFERAEEIVARVAGGRAVWVDRVHVQETRVNAAAYTASRRGAPPTG